MIKIVFNHIQCQYLPLEQIWEKKGSQAIERE